MCDAGIAIERWYIRRVIRLSQLRRLQTQVTQRKQLKLRAALRRRLKSVTHQRSRAMSRKRAAIKVVWRYQASLSLKAVWRYQKFVTLSEQCDAIEDIDSRKCGITVTPTKKPKAIQLFCPHRSVTSWKKCDVMKEVWRHERSVTSWKKCDNMKEVWRHERSVKSWKKCDTIKKCEVLNICIV